MLELAEFIRGQRAKKPCKTRLTRCRYRILLHIVVPGTGIEPVRPKAADFKSATSTNFVTRASSDRAPILHEWRQNVLSVDVKFAILGVGTFSARG